MLAGHLDSCQGQDDRRHDHYTISTCNVIVGVDGDAWCSCPGNYDAQQASGTSFGQTWKFAEKFLRLYAAVLNRFEADLRNASIRTGVQMVCEEKFDQQWLEVPTEHSYGVAWDVSLIHQYPATTIGNMRFESNELTTKIDDIDDFWLVFVHSAWLDAMTDLYQRKGLFCFLCPGGKASWRTGFGKCFQAAIGFGGYQANQANQVNQLLVSTIQGHCLQKVQVQAMNPNGEHVVRWTAKPSSKWRMGKSKKRVYWEMGKWQLIFLDACKTSRFFKPAIIGNIFRKPCPNIKFVKETSGLYTKGFGRCILCLDGWYDYCFSLRVLRSEHLLWIGSLAFTRLKLSNLQQFWYSMALVIIYAVQFYQGVFSRHHFSCALSGYNMCQVVPALQVATVKVYKTILI